MAESGEFSHLPFPKVYLGKPKLRGGGKTSEKTNQNRDNREYHGKYLRHRSSELSYFWKERRINRVKGGGPEIQVGIPILLEIEPFVDIEFLRGLGFEIVCEVEDGFIIVASEDINLKKFDKKVNEFIQNSSKRCNTPAKVYALCEDSNRLKKILSKDLYSSWESVSEDNIYFIDIGISCCGNVKLPNRPQKDKDETNEHYVSRENKWKEKFNKAYLEWDNIKMEREEILQNLVEAYDGEIMEMSEDALDMCVLPDSFSARLKINGKCLRDLVMNFPYIFEVSESEEIRMGVNGANCTELVEKVTVVPPLVSDPIVCVIDSGIQEEHKYLSSAILSEDSVSLIPNNPSTSDQVEDGGHGTRVAGAVLYPETIPTSGDYQLPCWIRNCKILDENNSMPQEIYPPKAIARAVEVYYKNNHVQSRIFNHSIGSRKPCAMEHMTSWAAEIDSQSYNNDVLFIQAAGNVCYDVISAYWQAGYPYPMYLTKELCRISDPAQSLQALTVGSISHSDFETEDLRALGKMHNVSSFSRSGPGVWDVLKPEVVEYGGTHAYNKGSNPPILSTPPEVCPELIRKSPQGPAFAKDAIGTSFAAPKVTYIAAQIEKRMPKSPTLLYRALIAQSARWPKKASELTKEECVSMLRNIGYGIPDVYRATNNDEYRITLITPDIMELGDNEAHIFKIPIPEELSTVGEDCDILIELTLSYAANPRRTRRYIKGYLSTWLDWCCSRIGERAETFAQRIFKTGSVIEDDGDFNWVLGEQTNRGFADGYSRKKGTLQKDWCIIKSNQLSDAFCIAVRGHKGWGSLFKAKYSLVVSFEAINQDIEIYEPIRAEIEAMVESEEIEVKMP